MCHVLALATIINNPAKYSIVLPAIDDQPYLQQVDLGAPINLGQAAKLAQMSLGELKLLNPGYCHMVTGPNGPYKLLLPIDRIPVFKQNLAASPALTKTVWAGYKVQRGDSLASIAKRFHTTVAELRDSNQVKNRAPVGKVIMIPTGTESVKPHLVEEETSPVPSPEQATPTNLASNQAQNSTPTPIQMANATMPHSHVVLAENTIQQPQTIADNGSNAAAVSDVTDSSDDTAPAPSKQFHTVKKGETLYSIANKYKVKASDLQKWNKLKSGKSLKLGSKLVIASSSKSALASGKKSVNKAKSNTAKKGFTTIHSTKPTHHVVRSGDSLHKIAKKHGVKVTDLKAKNHLKSNTVKPGQKLVVKD